MNRNPHIGAARLAAWALLTIWCTRAGAAPAAPAGPTDNALDRSQQIARTVSTVTGTSISPLIGITVLGAYTYAKTPKAARATLPFYCSPVFWIPILILVVLVVIKDTVGVTTPILKKPLDAFEILIVNKAALIFAFLPLVWHETAALPALHASGWLSGELMATVEAAAIDPSSPGRTLMPHLLAFLITAMAGMAVWLTSHAFDVLALLSPIPWLEVAVKICRFVAFAALALLSALNWRAGLILSLLIIGICLLCVWWALRLVIFGVVFAWDLLCSTIFGRRRDPSLDKEILAFTACAIGGMRKRSYGALRMRDDKSLEFVHRPVGIGLRTTVRLQSPARYQVGSGFFFPCVLARDENGTGFRLQFRLLPRYTGYEEEIRSVLGLGDVRDLRVPEGLRSAWDWLSGKPPRADAA